MSLSFQVLQTNKIKDKQTINFISFQQHTFTNLQMIHRDQTKTLSMMIPTAGNMQCDLLTTNALMNH